MNWTDIIVALISLAGAFIGTVYGIHRANNLTVYRIEQLEKKMDMNSSMQERVLLMEQELKEIKAQLSRIGDSVTRYGEQIDTVYTLADKNQNRIEAIERSIIVKERRN